MPLVNLEEVKPTAEAMKAVPQNMAELYKMLPLKMRGGRPDGRHVGPEQHDGAGRPAQHARHPAGDRTTRSALSKIEAALAKAYSTTKEETIGDLIAAMATDIGSRLRPPRNVDRHRVGRGNGQRRARPQAGQHGAADGHQGPRLGHSLRAVRRRVQDALSLRRRALRNGSAAPASRDRHQPAVSRSCRTSTSPNAACRRTAASN